MKQKIKKRQDANFLVEISSFAYSVVGRGLSNRLVRGFKRLESDIVKSGLYVYPPAYAALAFLTAIVVTVSSVAAYFMVPFIRNSVMMMLFNVIGLNQMVSQLLYRVPFLIPSLPFLLFCLMGLLTFGFFLFTPRFLSGSRSYTLEAPYVSAYLSILTDGGVPINKAFEYLSMEMSTLPEISKESNRLLRDIVVMGTDPLTAIDENVSIKSSSSLRDLLVGYVTTIRSGGDVRHFLEVKTGILFDRFKEMVAEFTERLQMFAEAFLLMLIVFPIVIIISTIISTASGYYAGSIDQSTFMMFYMFFYGLAPMLAVMLIIMAKSMEPK